MGNYSEDLDELIIIIKDYLDNIKKYPIVDYQTPRELSTKIDFSLPNDPGGNKKLFGQIKKYLQYAVKTGHPQFFNQLWSGFNFEGFLGEIITALTNTSMYTYEVAPVATLIELGIIKKLLDITGFPKGMGTFVTGGSNGNLLGMLLARNRALKLGKRIENLCVFYSEKAHYSLDTAAMVLGILKKNIIKVPVDEYHKMDFTVLETKIKNIISIDKFPFFISATAGTTVAGAFDPIEDIANVIKKYENCWLHIDGAHGAATLLSNKYKYLLNSSDLADSIVWDGHKIIGAPLICSIFLLRDKNLLNFHENNNDANDYLFNCKNEDESFNLGIYSLQCGRRADAIKLWLMWNSYGTKRLGERIDKLIELAEYAENKVKINNFFDLAIKREFVNVCFYYNKFSNLNEHDLFHKKIKTKLWHDGLTMVNIASINNKLCIRLVISNPTLDKSDIDTFFDNLLKIIEKLSVEYKYQKIKESILS